MFDPYFNNLFAGSSNIYWTNRVKIFIQRRESTRIDHSIFGCTKIWTKMGKTSGFSRFFCFRVLKTIIWTFFVFLYFPFFVILPFFSSEFSYFLGFGGLGKLSKTLWGDRWGIDSKWCMKFMNNPEKCRVYKVLFKLCHILINDILHLFRIKKMKNNNYEGQDWFFVLYFYEIMFIRSYIVWRNWECTMQFKTIRR